MFYHVHNDERTGALQYTVNNSQVTLKKSQNLTSLSSCRTLFLLICFIRCTVVAVTCSIYWAVSTSTTKYFYPCFIQEL
jgi:hypothetical protein